MTGWRLGISTQTPLVRWGDAHGGSDGRPRPATVGEPQIVEMDDPGPEAAATASASSSASSSSSVVVPVLHQFHITPGGVSRMVLQSLRHWHASGRLQHAAWFSLQPTGPRRVALAEPPVDLHHLHLKGDLQGYARTKEKLWADLHGLQSRPLDAEDFRHFMAYNHLTSDAILEKSPDMDALYVHDFQLLQVGAMVGLAAPCVLRWHVPFDARRIPPYTRNFLLRMMESFDAVIVSTRRDLEGLTNSGFRGTVRQIYPHADAEAPTLPASSHQAFADAAGVRPDHEVVLCVARMDPMKRQDLAIAAFARIAERRPRARLVLVGNGSFSGTKGTGLGLTKSAQWRQELEALARDLGVRDRVAFTGWMPDDQVAAGYQRADLLVLPSDIEGFGLTAFEAWAAGKPCVVTQGCGASEVVQDGVTGHVVPSGDAAAMADAFERILGHGEAAQRMGEAGRIALRGFAAAQAADQEWAVLEEARRRFRRHA